MKISPLSILSALYTEITGWEDFRNQFDYTKIEQMTPEDQQDANYFIRSTSLLGRSEMKKFLIFVTGSCNILVKPKISFIFNRHGQFDVNRLFIPKVSTCFHSVQLLSGIMNLQPLQVRRMCLNSLSLTSFNSV